MILHIVRSGEDIRRIADNYQIEVSDITSNNLHITDFVNLKAGMKLRIPFINKTTIDILEETESFISDYYPKVNFNEEIKEEIIKEVKPEVKQSTIDEVNISEEVMSENDTVTTDVLESVEKEKIIKPLGKRYVGSIIPDIPSKFIKKI